MIDKYRFQQYILLMRPYSIIDVGLVGLLGVSLSSGYSNLSYLGINAFLISILLWIGFNWFNESIQKDKGRIVIPIVIPTAIFIFTMIWYVMVFEFHINLILVVLSFLVYAHKHKYEKLTRYIFLLRGVNTVLLFMLFYHGEYSLLILAVMALLFFSQSYRSFIGDFRDIKYDKYTYMKKYSLKNSKIFLFILGVMSIISALLINIYIGVAVSLYIIYFTSKYYYMIDDSRYIGIESYKLHQHTILFTFLIKIILFLLYNGLLIISNLLIATIVLAVGIMLFNTYGRVIRPINLNKEVTASDSFI